MEKNTNMRLRDLSETKDEEVPQLQRKRKVVAQKQAPSASKKAKVDQAAASSKEPIFASVMPRKMKTRAKRENPAIFDKEWTPPYPSQGSSSDDMSSNDIISPQQCHPPLPPRQRPPPSPINLDKFKHNKKIKSLLIELERFFIAFFSKNR